MAIRMMVTFDSDSDAVAAIEQEGREIAIVRDYPGHEEGIRHSRSCPHHGKARQGTHKELTPECITSCYVDDPGRTPYKVRTDSLTGEPYTDAEGNFIKVDLRCDSCCHFRPLYMETTYRGRVLDTGEMNYHDDSDFYAVVWDNQNVCVKRVQYATTRGWTYPNGASVDATPATLEKARAYLYNQALQSWGVANEDQARKVAIGKVARVTTGKHKGAQGEIFYAQERKSQYGTWSYGTRLGITLDGIKEGRLYKNVVWVDAKNTEVVNWRDYLKDVSDAIRYAESACSNFRGMTAAPGMAFI